MTTYEERMPAIRIGTQMEDLAPPSSPFEPRFRPKHGYMIWYQGTTITHSQYLYATEEEARTAGEKWCRDLLDAFALLFNMREEIERDRRADDVPDGAEASGDVVVRAHPICETDGCSKEARTDFAGKLICEDCIARDLVFTPNGRAEQLDITIANLRASADTFGASDAKAAKHIQDALTSLLHIVNKRDPMAAKAAANQIRLIADLWDRLTPPQAANG